MDDDVSLSSSSDTDELDSCIWSLKNRQNLKRKSFGKGILINEIIDKKHEESTLENKYEKFEELKKKSHDIKRLSAKKLLNAEKRRSRKLVKKALKDPYIKELVNQKDNLHNNEEEKQEENEAKEWSEVKPFLNVNSHMQGPISHGDWGPKTELECTIEEAIKEGDFEKAELLSDTLANKEFAKKIAKAYSAKRSYEEIEKEKARIKDKNSKKIRWTFEAKERWQMKGNM